MIVDHVLAVHRGLNGNTNGAANETGNRLTASGGDGDVKGNSYSCS